MHCLLLLYKPLKWNALSLNDALFSTKESMLGCLPACLPGLVHETVRVVQEALVQRRENPLQQRELARLEAAVRSCS